jgi:adenylate kinase family enzyme
MLTPAEVPEIEPHLRRVMRDCRKLYASSADRMVRQHPTLLGSRADGFVQLMEDLHRGLLVKVYTTTVRGDGKWTKTEKYIGALLIEHIWDEHLRGEALRDASEKLFSHADQLQWPSLVGPFVRYEPLRDMVGQVETIVARLSNLIIKSDGLTTPDETDTLLKLQSDLAAALHPGRTGKDSPLSMPDDGVSVSVPGRGGVGGAVQDRTKVTKPEKSAEERLAEAFAELDSLIGIEAVKERVRSLSNFLQLQRQRQVAGLATMPISLHMAFVGNPGTGKTTVARIVGQIMGSMGILTSGHLVETDRSGLVAQYAGQTAVKTQTLCDSARGGVLFIDEAYSLIDSAGDDAFGREAIQVLLKRMEDDRDNLVVILAGYPDEMDQMIRSNPGLSSRINTRIKFDDYSPADLGQIFETLCKRNDYVLPPESRHRLLMALDQAYRDRDRHFGNGRLARNAFEDSVRRMADRIAGIVPLTQELMTKLTASDIMLPGVEGKQIDSWLKQPHTLRTSCSKCGKRLRLSGSALGRTVKCPTCNHHFPAPWADVER